MCEEQIKAMARVWGKVKVLQKEILGWKRVGFEKRAVDQSSSTKALILGCREAIFELSQYHDFLTGEDSSGVDTQEERNQNLLKKVQKRISDWFQKQTRYIFPLPDDKACEIADSSSVSSWERYFFVDDQPEDDSQETETEALKPAFEITPGVFFSGKWEAGEKTEPIVIDIGRPTVFVFLQEGSDPIEINEADIEDLCRFPRESGPPYNGITIAGNIFVECQDIEAEISIGGKFYKRESEDAN